MKAAPNLPEMGQFKVVGTDLFKLVWYYGPPNWQWVRRITN